MEEGGTLLAVATLVDFFYAFFLRAEHDHAMLEVTEQSLRHWLDNLVPNADRLGFAGLVEHMPFASLFNDLSAGDELMFLDTFSPQQSAYEEELKQAVRRGASIRLLLIKPDAVTAVLRGSEVDDRNYRESDRFREQIEMGLHRVEGYAKSLVGDPSVKGSLEVRLYSTLPCLPMYLRGRSDPRARGNQAVHSGYTGFFLSQPSFSGVHLEWRSASNSMLARFAEYFNRKWSDHTTAVWIDVPANPTVPCTKLSDVTDAGAAVAGPLTTRLIPGGVGGVYPEVLRIVEDATDSRMDPASGALQLDVLGLTLFSAWPQLLLPLLNKPAFVGWRLRILCLDPNYLASQRCFPAAWAGTARSQLDSIGGYLHGREAVMAERHLEVELRAYRHFPALHGFRVEGTRIVSWMDWEGDGIHLREPYQPYEILADRSDTHKMRSELFDSWWNQALGSSSLWSASIPDSLPTYSGLASSTPDSRGRCALDSPRFLVCASAWLDRLRSWVDT
jgi:hypothetical protein